MPRPFSRALALVSLALLSACVPLGQGGGGDAPSASPAEEISVTALPPATAAADEAAREAAPGPAEASADADETAVEAAIPAVEETPVDQTATEETSPEAHEATTDEAAPPPPPPSPEALACQRRGGKYVGTGSGSLKACVRPTGEGAKRCSRESDCKGVCLARSGTCSPVTPLFGCNDILQDDGRRVTLCIE